MSGLFGIILTEIEKLENILKLKIMESKLKAEMLICSNLTVISNLEWLYGMNSTIEELSKDQNFIKAIDCSYITVNAILELEDTYELDLEYWYDVKTELDIIRKTYTVDNKKQF